METARAEMLEIKEQKKKVKRDTLKQFIQMEKITGNVFNKQLVVFLAGKEEDQKIGQYIQTECMAAMNKGVKKAMKGMDGMEVLLASEST